MIVNMLQSDGERLSLDISAISATEWKLVREHTGYNPIAFFEAIARIEIEAVEGLYWLVQRRNSKPAFNIGAKDFEVLGFIEQWQVGEAEAAEKDKAPGKAKAPRGR